MQVDVNVDETDIYSVAFWMKNVQALVVRKYVFDGASQCHRFRTHQHDKFTQLEAAMVYDGC